MYSTRTCAKISELRRGVDAAIIYCVRISPSGRQLAVTSDKSTLHVFDIPHPRKPARSDTANGHLRLTSMGSGGSLIASDVDTSQKWGVLGRLPLLPKFFSDTYSFASAHFEIGEEPLIGPSTTTGDTGLRPVKGVIGWTSDQSMVVIGAGCDGRWEKFVIAEGEDGRRYCVRDGWKRYLGVN